MGTPASQTFGLLAASCEWVVGSPGLGKRGRGTQVGLGTGRWKHVQTGKDRCEHTDGRLSGDRQA